MFDDMMADMESNKKLSILCILEEENAIFYLFLCRSYFKVPKTIRLKTTHYFIMKIPNKKEL